MIYNEPMNIIRRCLDSVVDIVDEIIVYVDHKWSTSTLLGEYDIKFIKSLNLDGSVVEQYRNLMIEESSYKWILILDPDEYLDDEARRAVKAFKSDKINAIYLGFVFHRKNYEYNLDGEVIYLNNYPDRQMRLLYHTLRYPGQIHCSPVIPYGYRLLLIKGHIIHDKRHESHKEQQRKSILYRSKGGHDDVEL